MSRIPMGTHARDAWPGTWVAQRLGVRLAAAVTSVGPDFSTDVLASDGYPADDAAELRALVGLALRRNPRRAHLLVSTVLGKHIPQLPHVVHDAGLTLGGLARDVLGDDASGAVVLGYAETATGLGHCVAEALPGATYLHSTRRPVDGVAPLGGFEEEHSHATSHLLLPEDRALLSGGGPLVLVDDELTTGRTVLNTIETVHQLAPRARYVIGALIDVRTAADRHVLREFAARLGARVDVVALAGGVVRLPHDALVRGVELVAAEEAVAEGVAAGEVTAGDVAVEEAAVTALETAPADANASAARVTRLELDWPVGLPDGGRHGFTAAHQAQLERALPGLGGSLAAQLPGARRVLVLGFEELMYTPLRLARALADAVGGLEDAVEVRYSTTTRSPVLAVDHPEYAIRTRLTFPAHDDPADGPGDRFSYNVAPGTDAARRFDTIVLVVDSVADTPALHAPGGLLDVLSRVTDRVALAVLPSHVPSAPAPTSATPTTSATPSAATPTSATPTVPGGDVPAPAHEVAV